ncbi:chorismate lyase [Thiomicrospira sp. ALE5]|uniref:chorismate--pyruvate lyase family protein n=1 Tax=Thiomicrospira sp. ALE5 TaxID=748650 RepID=UPI0008E712A2|nr:chorismate lyase [Thiomicrospira sp. ALE5]SFR63902.1 chorismate lyase [Thiomicrospira sp. ALE5]
MPHARLAQRLYGAADINRLTLQPQQQAWLLDRASLTAKLQARCAHLQVQPLFEGWGSAYPFEQRAVASAPTPHNQRLHNQRVWIREVMLCCGPTPWIFARSVTLGVGQGQPWAFLRQQGQQPLGQRLFQDASIQRDAFLFSRWHWPPVIVQPTLARHCLYNRKGAELLLTEVFLPKLWENLHKKDPKQFDRLG